VALPKTIGRYEVLGELATGGMAEILLGRQITPSPTNELGVKGIGEAGTIAATASIINAIVDALSPLGITHVDMPATPDRLWKQIKEASK